MSPSGVAGLGVGNLRALVEAVAGSDDAEGLALRAGGVLARQLSFRELWFFDPESETLHARAGGLLPLEPRSLDALDPGSARLIRAACAAAGVCILEGETRGQGDDASKVALLALPLRRDGILIGLLGLVSVQAASFPPALLAGLGALSAPLVLALDRSAHRGASARPRPARPSATAGAQLETLAAAMAHEIRNPLAAMTQAMNLLGENPALNADDRTLISLVLEELGRVDRIAGEFLASAKPSAGRFAPVAVETLLNAVVALIRRDPRIGGAVQLETAIDADLPLLCVDEDKLRRVLWNLCLNAAQALSQGGHITLRARALVHGARDGVCIEVLDDGPGIPSRLREGAFRPFETTRAGGTGLGLALARHSIALHDGWIEIDDAPGGGACVRFWLPADGPAAVGSHADEEWD